MGVDTRILFDHKVRVDDIAKVMSILVGNKPEKAFFTINDGWATHVKGVKIENTSVVGMYHIILTPINTTTFIDGEDGHYGSFHFEYGLRPGNDYNEHMFTGKGLYVRASAFWIAMGKRLIDFFGGYMQYTDCGDDRKIDYMKPMPPYASACDGKAWNELQEAMLTLHPITQDEYKDANQYAAYKIGE